MEHLSQKQLRETAAAYEELLVPALFQEWADRLAGMDQIKPSHKVLDVACGTGVLARAIDKQLHDGSVTGLDVNPGMLTVARQSAPGIDWQQGRAEELPFEDQSFDTVVSQFGLMLFASPKKGLEEMRRVLKSGGHMITAVFDSIHQIPAYEVMADLFARVVDHSVGEALRYPFSMGDTDKLYSLFLEAGSKNPEITTQKAMVQFASPRHMVLSDVKGWFPFAQIHLDDQAIESMVQEAASVLEPFQTLDGSLRFEVSVHIVKVYKS
ncbi:class I SAM-dependent methyltransferase [Fodinibius sediminis]|uniref:Ubiquinone/menaquinone biosynthesis C-methylase UbiE n=1 Tax=Fodinibius sediminis TaxID=1214077 RepID=A0A521ELK5_9BACT|nr:methyltransferase domain-containing protein [Fodinibius sediminis]SMO84799.1 Ubiquinone/menaquinone biosynthesis C-methylase UbiE [Fodinibius sediminis]